VPPAGSRPAEPAPLFPFPCDTREPRPGGPTDEDRQEGGRQLSTEATPQPEETAPRAVSPAVPADESAAVPDAIPLLAPRDGLPPVIENSTQLVEYAEALAAGTGPVAVDAERASGYRYGQRAYLVQIRRNGSGTGLIDPVPLPDLSVVRGAIADQEWVLHAANQDLPCLAEIGLIPGRIFDTELAARLAGLPRVGLGAVVESLLGFSLQKGHSAADWSTRPLPEEWLVYAALDVEVLVDLRDALAAILEEQGKTDWARQEFEAILTAGPPPPRTDPWRRTSGVHGLRSRRQLGMLRSLWQARDDMARRRDVAPGRVLPDAAMVSAVQADPANEGALLELPVFRGRANRRLVATWFSALARGRALPEGELPLHSKPGEGPPPVNRWSDRDPAAATRLQAARAGLAEISAKHSVPVENVLSPDLVRRIMWSPPEPRDAATIADVMRAGGARQWQIGLTADVLTDAVSRA
jgi:ribonuclease D